MKPKLFPGDQKYKSDAGCLVSAVTTNFRCPVCRNPGYWRSGVGFEHEMRCGSCAVSWEPGLPYLVVWEVEEPK